jgi:ATP-dependent DNA helicase MPH1
LSDDDDDEFEVLSPPAAIRRPTTGGSNNPGAPAISAAEAARIARANAIRGLTGGSNAATNWLTTAQGSRPTTMGGKSTTKQPNQKNVKVTEWDPEKPQTQVVQTHLPFRPITPRKTGKTWDRTAYSKSGQRVVKKAAPAKKKGKKKKTGGNYWDDEAEASDDQDDEEEEDEEDGFDQFPMPFIDPSKCIFITSVSQDR